jgi:hypothetical protein
MNHMICFEEDKRIILSVARKRRERQAGNRWVPANEVIDGTGTLPRAGNMEARNGEAANLDRTA